MQVRLEVPSDHDRVFPIHRAAFEGSDEARLVSSLRSSAEPRLSLVAEVESQAVGHVFFSPVTIESPRRAPPAAGLAPMGVLPDHQGKGVGSALIRAGLETCPGLGWQAVFLVGDPMYYPRFGFVLASPLGLRYKSDVFDPIFQVIELESETLRGCNGWVHYHPAFDEIDTG